MVGYQYQAIYLFIYFTKSYDNDQGNWKFSEENKVCHFGECIYQGCDVIFEETQVFHEIHGDGFSKGVKVWGK